MPAADWGLIVLMVGVGALAVLMTLEHRDVLKDQCIRDRRRWLEAYRRSRQRMLVWRRKVISRREPGGKFL